MAPKIWRIEAPLMSANQLRIEPIRWLQTQRGGIISPFALNHVDGLEALRKVVSDGWKDNPKADTLHAIATAFDHGKELAALLYESGVPDKLISRNLLAKEIGCLRPTKAVFLPGAAVYRTETSTDERFAHFVNRVFPHLDSKEIRTKMDGRWYQFSTTLLSIGLTWKKSPK